MHKRLVTSYATQNSIAADENQRRIEAVFTELAANQPDNISYIVLRLADDSFVHLSFHDHADNEVNPITSTPAFAHFQQTMPHAAKVPSTNKPQSSSALTSRRLSEGLSGRRGGREKRRQFVGTVGNAEHRPVRL